MKGILIICLLLFFGQSIFSQDTFSIIAADPDTGEIGAAGATCVDGIAQWGGIQLLNKIIPGRGGVNAQAWICLNPHINLDNAITQLNNGLSPEEIIVWLQANDACSSQGFNPAYRQYGIVDFDAKMAVRTAAFTGEQADDYKGHITGVNYAIQGNILLGPEIIEGMEAGFINTEGSLASKLMAAMQGANVPGADSRCLARGTTSTSAFLRVYKPDDSINNPFLNLSILEMPFGEEPIDSLQSLFDTWVSTTAILETSIDKICTVFPNPVSDRLNINFRQADGIRTVRIIDLNGRLVHKESIDLTKGRDLEINVSVWTDGVYVLKIMDGSKQLGKINFLKH